MRIIAGRHKGRSLSAPKGRTTRPTAGRAREGLFNILAHGGYGPAGGSAIAGARVLDAFAGSGAFALEALSRGAEEATLMDLDERAVEAARANAQRLDERGRAHVLRMDATRPRPARHTHDLVFLDPPYGAKLGAKALAALAAKGWIAPGALVIAEVAADEDFIAPTGFELLAERVFGAARFALMRFGESD